MKLDLLDFIELENCTSGSGIELYNDKLYIVGEKFSDLLVMRKKWSNPAFVSLPLADAPADIDPTANMASMTVLQNDKKSQLLIIGSGSTAEKSAAIFVNLKNDTGRRFDLRVFYDRIRSTNAGALNIEGIAEVYDYVVLVNRSSADRPLNQLLITKPDFWKNQEKAPLQMVTLDFESVGLNNNPAVSGITYSDKHEDLFLTINTPAWQDDKGDMHAPGIYLGVVENLYRKIGREKGKMKINHLVDLQAADKNFAGYTLEAVCIQSEKDHSVKLQLLTDDENGINNIFKVNLDWES